MSVAEGGNHCGFLGLCWFNLCYAVNLDEAAIDAMAAAEEGVYSVAGVDFVGGDNVL